MDLPLSLTAIIVVNLAVGLGCALQGSVGYGAAIVAAPILVLVEPQLVPIPIALALFTLTVLMTLRERSAIDIAGLKWAIVGRVLGSILGAIALVLFSADNFTILFAVLILLAVGISISGLRFPPSKYPLIFAGFLSGIMGTIAAIGGPPMALVYQNASGNRLRSTLSGYFIISILVSCIAWLVIGRFGFDVLYLTIFLLPGVLGGFFISSRITRVIDRGYTRPVVLILAAISASVVLIRQIAF
jgi:uncharacterized protein